MSAEARDESGTTPRERLFEARCDRLVRFIRLPRRRVGGLDHVIALSAWAVIKAHHGSAPRALWRLALNEARAWAEWNIESLRMFWLVRVLGLDAEAALKRIYGEDA